MSAPRFALQEMRLLAEMDNPTSAVDVYVNHLTTLLTRKATSLASFQVMIVHGRPLLPGVDQCTQ